MGLFDKLFPKKKSDTSQPQEYEAIDAYVAEPNFYQDQDGQLFGSFALTEGTVTLLPKRPQAQYAVDGNAIQDYRLAVISTSVDDMLGIIDYGVALFYLSKLAIQETENHIVVPALSLAELQNLIAN